MDIEFEETFLSKETTELLNNLTYQNYGILSNSNSTDLSSTNRLAICTDKLIIIINQNLQWPSLLNNPSPFKFFLNDKKSQTHNKQKVQLEQWIQDLIDSKNDSHFINIIRHVPKSTKHTQIFKQFFTLDEYKQSKYKSFQKQLQLMCKRSINNDTRSSLLRNNLKEADFKCLKEENNDEFNTHKILYDQIKLFDLDLYQFLSFLNPFSSGTAQENNLQDSFKLCKWNLSHKLQILFALTEYNQAFLFDCTKIQYDNTSNELNSNCDESNSKIEYEKIFDLKSQSKMINLTDFLILNTNLINCNNKHRSLDEYISEISKITPKIVSWGPRVYEKNQLAYELLLIGFKSNHIGIFYVYSNFKLELFKMIDLTDKINSIETDELVDTSLSKKLNFELSEIKLSDEGVLAIGLKDSRIFLYIFENESKFVCIQNVNLLGSIKKIDFCSFDNDNFVLVVQTLNQIGFFLINKIDLEQKSQFLYELNESRYTELIVKPVKNYLTQGMFKFIDFKILNNLNFLLIFENSFIDLLEMKIDDNLKIILSDQKVLNNCMDINFDAKLSSTFEPFKTSKNIFLSQNNYLLYQINDFTKSCLVQKKPANFQVNIYRLKNLTEREVKGFLSGKTSDQCLIKVNDFIWLFKHDLYLKNESFLKQIFGVVYENFKFYRTKLNGFETREHKLTYLKRVRILAFLMRNYFVTISSFETFNSGIETDMVDESSEESDFKDEDEMDVEQVVAKKESTEEEVIKTGSFYDHIFRETSLLIFKYHCLDLILESFRKGYDCLGDYEKLLLIFIGDFSIRKNFLQNDLDCEISGKEFEIWLKENTKKSLDKIENENLSLLLDKIRCDLCGRKFSFESNLDLAKIKCESGHQMNRCEKTLLSLNNFKYKRCCMCNSKWNYFEIENAELKIFGKFLLNRVDYCLFCD
ncbi:unnamed protein product [Brachionus calyciflorus]|uniref:Transcription factor IIIC putative zinc-finger domain-containing protein n=1 Tax=Brachionus calyciflorus TaxID=104777 RepID=A0A814EVS1_9BILA|nr:unnamed protein product [Brachionus calyciflorus]